MTSPPKKRLRGEFLDRELFGGLREARVLIEGWRVEYNHFRPHSSLGYTPPAEYAKALNINPTTSHRRLPLARRPQGSNASAYGLRLLTLASTHLTH